MKGLPVFSAICHLNYTTVSHNSAQSCAGLPGPDDPANPNMQWPEKKEPPRATYQSLNVAEKD